MLRFWFRLFVIVALIAAFVAPAFLIPCYLGSGAEPVPEGSPAEEDVEAVNTFQDAYRMEKSGNLEEALAKYRAAEKAKGQRFREVANHGTIRVNDRLLALQPYYDTLRTVQKVSAHIFPFALVILIIGLFLLISTILPRRGIELQEFNVTPLSDAHISAEFNRALAYELGRIVRTYGSEQFARIGVKVAMPGLVANGERNDIGTRALAAFRDGDGLQTAATFSMGEILNYFKNTNTRPKYKLSGSVVVTPQGATADATLTQASNDKVVATWLAQSAEAYEVAMNDREIIQNHHLSSMTEVASVAESVTDTKENTSQVLELAVVLACKIWHSLAQGKRAEMRPSSWRTVFLLVRSLQDMEYKA